MAAKQSNIIPKIQPLHIDMRGENYAFNGCGRLVMDNLGEADYDYSFFAGITGDNFAQFYPYRGIPNHGCRKARGESATDYRVGKAYIESVFSEIGYAAEFVTAREVLDNKEQFTRKLINSIDNGVPVIQFNYYWSALVGYENNGDIILRIVHEDTEPTKFSLGAELFDTLAKPGDAWQDYCAWVFVGEKTEQKDLTSLYRNAILRLPKLLTTKTDDYCFGAQAFREWANEIERGEIFTDGITDDSKWWDYCNYVCNFETNAYCCHGFLQKAKELNPDLAFLDKVSEIYKSMSTELSDDGGLEQLGGGFNVTFEVLENPPKRKAIADKLREYAAKIDEIVRLITEKMASEIALCESFEYIKLGKVRFIGMDARQLNEHTALEENWEHLWERSGEYMPALNELAAEYGADITAPCSMMHHNGHDVDSENHYLAGRFFKADTPVPEGYDYYDVPTENAAYAVYTTNCYDSSIGAAYFATRDKVLADGVGIPYPHAYWHAEVYTDGRPHDGHYRFVYLFSVDEKAEGKIV